MTSVDVTVPLAPAPARAAGRPWRGRLALLGPAFVAAVAYVDPGNFATNFSGGASFGYTLVWVVVAANLMAVLIQSLSAKLGLATGRSLPELCRDRFPRAVSLPLWVQAEAVAIATDLAEVLGGAIALYLLFDVPLPLGGVITGGVAMVLTTVQSRGRRRFEVVIGGLLAVVLVGFLYDLAHTPTDPVALAGGLLPSFAGTESVFLAAGILGATVMPHAIYAHSALAERSRYGAEEVTRATPRETLRWQRTDIGLAMGVAGLINLTMLVIAAGLFQFRPDEAATLEGVHSGFGQLVGGGAAAAFALALLASGFASSGVGTYAGQVIMAGFLRRRVPVLVRRLVTLAPALIVLALGVDPTRALVVSQVVLSFGVPFALVPLILFTARRSVMGRFTNRPITTVLASVAAALIIALNGFLVWTLLTG
jgi:manganese transport protein